MNQRRMRSVIAAGMAGALWIGATGCAAPRAEIEVCAGQTDRPAGPVWVTLPADVDVAAGAVRVVAEADRKPVPAQADGHGQVCLWLDAMKAGTEGEFLILGPDASAKDRVTIDVSQPRAAVVKLDGKEFTTYRYPADWPRPYLYPVIGPTGAGVTRNFPMKKGDPTEREDHPHHTSLWTAHGDVNGVNHWHVTDDPSQQGHQVHRKFLEVISGPVFGRLVALIDWNDPNGKRQLTEHRTYTFYAPTANARLMDVEVKFLFTDGDVTFGDTKEGGLLALRVAGTMKEKSGGTILNANGLKGAKAAWGKPAPWCDYYGPVAGKTVGLTIMDAPSNPGYPTRYHVRDYGLFTANIFGLSHFVGKGNDGSRTWKNGETVTFDYRLYIHRGDTEQAGVAKEYALFATPPKVEVEVEGRENP
jgi:hypothetical protein